MKCVMLLFFTLLLSVFSQAREYSIKSASDLETIVLQPGDKIVLADTTWANQKLVFKGKGSETSPIVLACEKPGKVKITGNSSLLIDGSWLVADGLFFTEGFSRKEDVILFSGQSNHCRLTNSAILNYNPADKTLDYKWVSLNGSFNRVDHCWFEGKTHQGTTLVVWLSDTPNYHHIDHNYFGRRPALGANGGETVRIGTSTWSFHDSFTTLENNIFEKCNGEVEIVSNKSCKNVFKNNLFYECEGTLTLRHGNNAEVSGNFFIGNGMPKTGGIRIICENHNVHDNYMQGLTGTELSAAISVMEGLPNPELTSHWQVKNAAVTGNVFINCKEVLAIGAGKNSERILPPLNSSFVGNTIIGKLDPVNYYDDKASIKFSENTCWGMSEPVIRRGFLVRNPELQKEPNGLYRVAKFSAKPFWMLNDTGPSWKKGLYKIIIKD